mgnify:CR=1 FL=1
MSEAIIDRIRKAGAGLRGFKPKGVSMDTLVTDKEATGLDSIGRVELTLALEEELGVTIGDEELDGIKTFGDLVALLEGKAHVHRALSA